MYNKLKFFLVFLSCLLSSSFLLASSSSLAISNISIPSSTLSEGDSFSTTIKFYAVDDCSFSNLKISGDAVDTSNMDLEFVCNNKSYSLDDLKEISLEKGTQVTVTASGLAYTGTDQDLTVTLSYKKSSSSDKDSDSSSVSSTVSLKVTSNSAVQGALILDASANSNMSASMNAGESKKLSLELKNTSSTTLKNSIVKVAFADTTVGLSITSGNYTELSTISSNETKTVYFTVSASSEVKAGTYKINVTLNDVSQTLLLNINSNATPPVIELGIDSSKVFNLGENNALNLNVANVGGTKAKNIKLEILNETDVAVIGSSNVKYIDSLGAKSTTSYATQIQLDSSTSTDMILLKVGLTYFDESDTSYTDTQTIYLNTNSLTATNDMSITNVSTPSGSYGPNEAFNVSFKVTSKNGAEDVKISVNPPDNIIPRSQNVFVLSKLAAGESKTYNVSFTATDEITTSNYPIEILLEYEYKGSEFSMSQYTSVNVINEADSDDLTSPKAIISQFTSNPQVVKAGEDLTLDLTFLNTHPTKTIYNLTAAFSSSEEASLSPVSSSNTLFAAKLVPGASSTQNLTLSTLSSATAGTYDLTVKLSYQDEEGNELSSEEIVPITISQNASIDVAQIDLSSITLGRTASLTATIYNTSKTDISNVMIYIEGDGFEVTDNKSFLSTFSMGATEYYAPTLTGMTAGTHQAELVVQYENFEGEIEEIRYPFEVEVVEATKSNMPNDKMMTKQTSTTHPWLIGGGAILLVAFILFFLKTYKKRKNALELNE